MEENIATEMMKRSSTQETYGKVQSAIRILALFVFVGWIFIWIMIPTNTYTQNWFPHLQAKTTSIYFGEQGTVILIHTFPAIFIAVLGCVYLHLAKKSNGSNMDSCDGKKHKASIWKRPMLIKGPLAIVCGTEIVFLVMFIALLIWSYAIYLYTGFATITPKSAAAAGTKVWVLKLKSAALRLGLIGNICLAFLFFPVARGSSVLPLFGLTSENSIKYHIWLGHIVMIIFTSHGICFIIYWALTNQISQMLKWDKGGSANVAGELALIIGARTLINTFPVILIAVLGCVYLHLAKKSNGSNMDSCDGKKHKASIWKRPMLIKGPLGIVCGTEIVFLVMFIALLIWSFAIYLYNDFASITPESEVEYGAKVWELKLESVAQRLGVIGNICLAFLFFPVIRSSSVLPLFGLTSENSIKYHIWLGHIVMILFTSHGLCYIIYWALTNQISEMLKWDKEWVSNVAGELALAFGLFMWIATIPRIRRKMFELFFYTHILYILFIIFFIFHVGISNTCIMLPGFYLFLVDRYLRFLQSRHQVHLISARILSCETVELNFSKGHELTYNPTSTMFLNIPSISKLQWHPFTVTSNSNLEQEKLSVVIKSEGTWTQKLYKLLSSPSTIDRLGVSIEGPYGPASTNYLRYDILVLISGGSAMVVSAAFLLNKKHNAKEEKNIHDLGGSTSIVSPSSMSYNTDRELESLPCESLVQATNVHYGIRPDLKRLLFEIKGSSVGVLVAGPKKMREDVAAICSSDLAENLHFESISFSW
ncbi:hypothetical protein TanjilG_22480 [Lupinus angustifolius]|uniref:FAD-binding FR-type domain-containing protein n=1 Tax=Lupinus angustifolius TaxID=3871 RepID=A0A4P1RS02_LUPAN|nr:hypothetical protein TanjilG_22480 [Lupinus angustifolius]